MSRTRQKLGAGAWLLALALGLAVACEGQGGEEGGEEGGDEVGDAQPPVPAPVILEPLRVSVGAADREDLTIAVAQLQPDTRVEIDGRSWSLREAGPVSRAGQTLRVPLGGALAVGTHELVLVHRVDREALRSEALVIEVEAATLAPLLVSLASAVVGSGDRLVEAGPDQSLLALLDEAGQTLELRLGLGEWSTAGVVHALPGLVSEASPRAGAVVTVARVGERVGEIDGDREQGPWVLTAWLAEGGARVRGRLTPVERGPEGAEELGEPGELLELWNLDDPEQRALLGPHQLARNHGVALLDRMVVIAVEARRDADQPSPGDHLLLTRWLTADGLPAAPLVVRGPSSRDLDHPARARRWLDLGPSPAALSIRLALGFPWLLELGGNGLPRLTGDPGEAASVPASSSTHTLAWLASADGALGSRHLFALELGQDQGRLRVLVLDRWGGVARVELLELPGLPRAAPSLSSVAGSPTVVIPMGAEQPAVVLRSDGAALVVDSLAGLACDALVVAEPSPAGEGDTRALACVAQGGLRVGTLGVD